VLSVNFVSMCVCDDDDVVYVSVYMCTYVYMSVYIYIYMRVYVFL